MNELAFRGSTNVDVQRPPQYLEHLLEISAPAQSTWIDKVYGLDEKTKLPAVKQLDLAVKNGYKPLARFRTNDEQSPEWILLSLTTQSQPYIAAVNDKEGLITFKKPDIEYLNEVGYAEPRYCDERNLARNFGVDFLDKYHSLCKKIATPIDWDKKDNFELPMVAGLVAAGGAMALGFFVDSPVQDYVHQLLSTPANSLSFGNVMGYMADVVAATTAAAGITAGLVSSRQKRPLRKELSQMTTLYDLRTGRDAIRYLQASLER